MESYEYLAAILRGERPQADRALVHDTVAMMLRATASPTPDSELRRIALLSQLVAICLDRYRRSRDPEELDDAVAAQQEVAARSPIAVFSAADEYSNLAIALRTRFEHRRERADLEAAVEAGRTAVARLSAADQNSGAVLANLAGILRMRASFTTSLDDMAEALLTMRKAVAVTPDEDPNRPVILANFVDYLAASGAMRGSVEDLRQALEVAAVSEAVMPAGHERRPKLLTAIAGVQRELYVLGAGPEYLQQAVEGMREHVDSLDQRHPDYGAIVINQVALLKLAYDAGGDVVHLDEAIAHCRRLAENATDTPGVLAMAAVNRGGLLHLRFQRFQEPADLDEAAIWARRGVQAHVGTQSEYAAAAVNLAAVLKTSYRRRGDPEDLSEAVALLRSAIELKLTRQRRAEVTGNLAIALRTSYQRTGDLAELTEAVRLAEQAVDLTQSGHSRYAHYLALLGSLRRSMYEVTGNGEDLNDAVRRSREAVEAAVEGDGELAMRLSNLSLALLRRFDRNGSEPDLAAGVRLAWEAVDRLEESDSRMARARGNLGNALRARFEYTGESDDLHKAVELVRKAVDATEPGSTALPVRLTNLGTLLLRLFEAGGVPEAVNDAVEVLTRAVQASQVGAPAYAMYLSNLGLALFRRYETFGATPDLSAAVSLGEAALAATPADHPDLVGYRSNLVGRLLARHESERAEADLTAAIAHGEAALAAVSDEHQITAGILFNLGLAYQRDENDPVARRTAAEMFDRCAALTSAQPLWRAAAAAQSGRLAAEIGDTARAAAAFEAAIDLLPRLASRGMSRTSRQSQLRHLEGIGGLAAAAQLSLGNPERALAVLEQARGVLLGQELDYRGDLGRLRQQNEGAEQEFRRLQRVLAEDAGASAGWPGDDEPPQASGRTASADLVRRRSEAARQWDELTESLRANGHPELFQRPDAARLAAAARGGVVVAVNVTPRGCVALAIGEAGQLPPIPLPDLAYDECIARVNEMLSALEDNGWTMNDRLLELLGWLWTTVADPILSALGYTSTPREGQEWPRIWWMPCGPLAFAPIHAAGHHAGSGPPGATVVDRVVSSYTPTIRALEHARQQATQAERDPLVVAVTRAPNQDPLLRAVEEGRLVADRLGPTCQRLFDAQASHEAVRTALLSSGWAHLVCHATTDPSDPSSNALLLQDRPLEVRHLAMLQNSGAYLAYLASCRSAFSGTRLLDESIHVVSSMQLAGFAHVIGTLWFIGDEPTVVDQVYEQLARFRDAPAAGLHRAMRALRDRYPRNPALWAPTVHIGP